MSLLKVNAVNEYSGKNVSLAIGPVFPGTLAVVRWAAVTYFSEPARAPFDVSAARRGTNGAHGTHGTARHERRGTHVPSVVRRGST
jgi:hypothetical protein